MVRLDSLRNGARFQLPDGRRGAYHGAMRSEPLQGKVTWADGGRRGLLPLGEMVIAAASTPAPAAAAAWPPAPGRQYTILAPVLRRERFTGEYERVPATCQPPRWPAVRDAADFRLPNGRVILVPSQQVLS